MHLCHWKCLPNALQRIEKERALQEGFWVKQAMKEQQQLVESGSVGPQVQQLAATLAAAQSQTGNHKKEQKEKHQLQSGASSSVSCSKSVSAVGSSSSKASRLHAGSMAASSLGARSGCAKGQRQGASGSQCGSTMTSTTAVGPTTAALPS